MGLPIDVTFRFPCKWLPHLGDPALRSVASRTQATKTICNREEQNHPLFGGEKGVSGNSGSCDTASSWQYWGRRRYGPVQ